MTKLRVYELARELNMTNKDLIEKIRSLEIDAKSHMSTLEDGDIDKIKADIRGDSSVTIEETRIRPTVIRRRKKEVQPPPEEVSKAPEPPPAPEETEAPEEVEAPEEIEASEAPTDTAPPEEPVAEQAQEETETHETADQEAPSDDGLEAPPQAEESVEAVSEIPPETVAEEKVATEPVEDVKSDEVEAEAKPVDNSESAPVEEEKDEKRAKPVRKKKKKDMPAKIIQLPTPGEKEPEKAAPQEPARVAGNRRKPAAADVPPVEKAASAEAAKEEPGKEKRKDKKRKKHKDETTDAATDNKFFKKKISFRRKEVVEGADLYSDESGRMKKARKGAKTKAQKGQKTQITVPKAIKRRIKIDETIVLSDLAKRMGIKANEMIAKLIPMGVMATVNQTIDFETAALVAAEFGYEVEKASFEEESLIRVESDDPQKLMERPPVVTIMGHVDHGKTSLLDIIRKSRVTDIEAGGITQHIGAYLVETEKGRIVFLDTPGHEAFTAMRARGAKVTDLVVLVVAADDGAMPQTIEAINHSRAAGVPIIVAVNKIDKKNADPDRVLRELAEQGLVPEDWGGDTIFVKVSAKQNTGIDDLLEMILLQSEVLELKANPEKRAIGHVVEAKLDSGRGPVATLLVQDGTLHTGDAVVCGVQYGKIRAMIDDRGETVMEAGPSTPVEILGLSGVPNAGDEMVSLEDDKSAKQVSEHRLQKQRALELAKTSRLSLDKLYEKMQQGEVKDLNLIIKADVQGSIEALRDSLTKLSNAEVNINVAHAATGAITESDVALATVSNAIIIGFNVRPSAKVQTLAQEENVDIRYYNIIYNAIKDLKDAIVGMMSSTYEERILGRAEVRETFQVPKVGMIAGSYVTDGKLERGRNLRLIRDGVVLHEGKNGSLRRFKDDVKEVQSGYECGIGIENYNDVKVGDVLEFYYFEEIKPEVD